MRCLIICVIVVCVVGLVSCTHDCKMSLIHILYKELNCKPNYKKKSQCPTSYNCSEFDSRDLKQCYYDGVSYKPSTMLNTPGKCHQACICSVDGKHKNTGAAAFSCAHVECPHIFHPPKPSCKLIYQNISDCCPYKTDCEKPEDGAPKCKVDGWTYREGEKFYPDGTCQTCICKQGYKGVNVEPYCEEVKCDSILTNGPAINNKCVPVYFGENGCCPIEWVCPNKDHFKVVKSKKKNKSTVKCMFGDLEVEVKDKVDVNNSQINCICQTPPMITCIMSRGKAGALPKPGLPMA